MILVAREEVDHPDARWLLDQLSDTLTQLTGSSGRARFNAAEMMMPGRCFAVARNGLRQPIGCGAFRPLQPGVAELKRMFALPGSRGAGAALLHFLEQQARREGYRQLWLETRRVNARAGFLRAPRLSAHCRVRTLYRDAAITVPGQAAG